VLTNSATFKGHTPLQGASSFLIRTGDNQILAATALHLIGSAGGVEPKVELNQFGAALQSWKMHPRTVSKSFVEIAGLGMGFISQSGHDWLILRLKASGDKLPAQPLRLRPDPVRVGEKVYLIGCSYQDQDAIQNVYTGTVTEREYAHNFRYSVDPP